MKDWDDIFRKIGAVHVKPSKDLVGVVQVLKRNKVVRVLDLGCGMGRHLEYLKDTGFRVYGCDKSDEALRVSGKIIASARLKKAEMSKLPYRPGFFDLVLSTAVIQHGKIAKIKRTISEITRVLKKGGFVFIETLSAKDSSYGKGKEVEKGTFTKTNQLDGDIPHHYFTEEELRGFFKDYKILRLDHRLRDSTQRKGKKRSFWVLFARKE